MTWTKRLRFHRIETNKQCQRNLRKKPLISFTINGQTSKVQWTWCMHQHGISCTLPQNCERGSAARTQKMKMNGADIGISDTNGRLSMTWCLEQWRQWRQQRQQQRQPQWWADDKQRILFNRLHLSRFLSLPLCLYLSLRALFFWPYN